MRVTQEKATITTLTPDAARKLLANNDHNRPLKNDRIHILSRAILEGRWRLNGASIVVDRKGRLLDGQHKYVAGESAAELALLPTLDILIRRVTDTLWIDS